MSTWKGDGRGASREDYVGYGEREYLSTESASTLDTSIKRSTEFRLGYYLQCNVQYVDRYAFYLIMLRYVFKTDILNNSSKFCVVR